jgi:hypothetical protein
MQQHNTTTRRLELDQDKSTTSQRESLCWRRRRRVGASEEGSCKGDQFVQQHPILNILKLAPQLQRKNSFENTIRWLAWEFFLNGKFVKNGPKGPALGSKINPY